MNDETQVPENVLQHDENAVEETNEGTTVGSDSAQTITVDDAVNAEDQPNR